MEILAQPAIQMQKDSYPPSLGGACCCLQGKPSYVRNKGGFETSTVDLSRYLALMWPEDTQADYFRTAQHPPGTSDGILSDGILSLQQHLRMEIKIVQ